MISDIIYMIALTASVKICKYFNQNIKFNNYKKLFFTTRFYYASSIRFT